MFMLDLVLVLFIKAKVQYLAFSDTVRVLQRVINLFLCENNCKKLLTKSWNIYELREEDKETKIPFLTHVDKGKAERRKTLEGIIHAERREGRPELCLGESDKGNT